MKKTFLLILSTFFLFACKEDQGKKEVQKDELDFTYQTMTAEDFELCSNSPCPKIQIDYLDFDKKGISKKIGQAMDNRRAMILKISEEDLPENTSLKDAVKNFIAEFTRFRKEFPDFEPDYEVRIKESIAHKTDEILVVKIKYYIYTGGAHGYGATNFRTFSLDNGNLLETKDLFSDFDAFKKYSEEKFREKYSIPIGENINSTGFFFENDVFALPNNIGILEDEVVLIYNAYEAAAYANGEMVLKFPKSEVGKWLEY